MRFTSSDLDPEQRAVVEADCGPVLVVAGAGTGKTRTLTHRVNHLVESGVPPDRILLLTFTQRAAREMTDRVITHLGDSGRSVWAGTFHAIGARLLRTYAHLFGYEPHFSIVGPRDALRVFANATQDVPVPNHIKLDDVLSLYSLSLNSNRDLKDLLERSRKLAPSDLPWIDHLVDLYIAAKMVQQVMDYDDLLTYWYMLLSDEQTREEITARFDAVLVDEYQDVCPLQARIVDALASDHRNLTVVGDDCQAIYGFRGADVGAILGFGERYPECSLLRLQTNYRSSPEIVSVANASISHNHRQHSKRLVSMRGTGPKPTLVDASDADQVAQFVAHRILALKDEGVPLSEQAVLYRTHAQARVIQVELQRQGIPFTVRSGLRVFDRPHVRTLLAFCRAQVNPWDLIAWRELLETFDGLGPVAAEHISSVLMSESDPWRALIERDLREELPARFRAPWVAARSQLALVIDASSGGVSAQMAVYCEHVLGPKLIREFSDDAHDRIADLDSLCRAAGAFPSAAAFMDALTLSEGVQEADSDHEAVVLSTVHRAKGLEWAGVFLIGLYDGGFPLWSYNERGANLEEERRLFYVAVTRATRWLYLCHPWSDQTSGQAKSLSTSPFIDELGPGMLDHWRLEHGEEPGEPECVT